jgi:hypothetical protein
VAAKSALTLVPGSVPSRPYHYVGPGQDKPDANSVPVQGGDKPGQDKVSTHGSSVVRLAYEWSAKAGQVGQSTANRGYNRNVEAGKEMRKQHLLLTAYMSVDAFAARKDA